VLVLPTTEASDDVLCNGILFWLGAVLFDHSSFSLSLPAAALRAVL
jgi:hypothetical protein